MDEMLQAYLYCGVYAYILWMNKYVGKKEMQELDFILVKVITAVNMLLSIGIYQNAVQEISFVFPVLLPYGGVLMYRIQQIGWRKKRIYTLVHKKSIICGIVSTTLLMLLF